MHGAAPKRKNPAICGAFFKRLKGLEPSTFCMATARQAIGIR
jgi:hypothetical protein